MCYLTTRSSCNQPSIRTTICKSGGRAAATDQQPRSRNAREARNREDAMPDSNDRADVGQLWRSWLTDTESAWNDVFDDVMGTDSFGRFMGGYMDIYSTFQRMVAQNMERSLSTLNVTTRRDILDLS